MKRPKRRREVLGRRELFEAPRCTRLESIERSFVATHSHTLSLVMEYFDGRSRPLQNDKRLYQLLHIANLRRGCPLLPSLDKALGAPLNVLGIAVAKQVKAQD